MRETPRMDELSSTMEYSISVFASSHLSPIEVKGPIPIEDRGELIALNGHIQMRDGKPVVHLHAVLSFRDGSTKAGHVFEARVQPLAEITIVATGVAR
mgnify:CR=1 FL=1